MSKLVAFVPVKLNNERCPGKNIRPLGGVPLVTRVFNTIKKVRKIDEIYCFCSQEEIKPYLPDGVKLLKRPEWIDGSKVSGNEIYKAFAETIDSDYYLAVQCTSPFITPESIQKGVDAVLSGENDSSFSVTEHREFLWQGVKPYLMPNFDPANIIRTQDMNPFYIESCAFWVFNKSHIMEENKRTGNTPHLVTVSKIEAVDIDYPEDFTIAEAIVKSMSNE